MRRIRGGLVRSGRPGYALSALLLTSLVACEDESEGAGPADPSAEGPQPEETTTKTRTGPESAPEDDRFVIETQVESYETFVDIHPRGRERPGWHLRLKETSLQPRWDRERPRSTQERVLAAMLQRLRREHEKTVDGASVTVGLSALAYPEYVERLARHAADDPGWKALRAERREVGTARVAALHDYIVEATRAHRFHEELDRVFASIDRRLALDGVEKCGTARPGDGSEPGRWLEEQGLRSRLALPIGCLMAWFDLEPAGPEGD